MNIVQKSYSNPKAAQRRAEYSAEVEYRYSNVPHVMQLLALLPVPFFALTRLPTQEAATLVGLGFLSLNGLTFFIYHHDKHSSRLNSWRVSEATLHLMSLLGGWIGAYAGQRFLRHKSQKPQFQFVFWLTVLLHQIGLLLLSTQF